MHEFENKRVAKWAPRKCMKKKGRFFLDKGEVRTKTGIVGTHPPVFARVANTGLTGYGK
jgi:hypothetical protein